MNKRIAVLLDNPEHHFILRRTAVHKQVVSSRINDSNEVESDKTRSYLDSFDNFQPGEFEIVITRSLNMIFNFESYEILCQSESANQGAGQVVNQQGDCAGTLVLVLILVLSG